MEAKVSLKQGIYSFKLTCMGTNWLLSTGTIKECLDPNGSTKMGGTNTVDNPGNWLSMSKSQKMANKNNDLFVY